jgi:hypothetical protein
LQQPATADRITWSSFVTFWSGHFNWLRGNLALSRFRTKPASSFSMGNNSSRRSARPSAPTLADRPTQWISSFSAASRSNWRIQSFDRRNVTPPRGDVFAEQNACLLAVPYRSV